MKLWRSGGQPRMRVYFPEVPPSHPTPAIVVFRGGAYSTPMGSGAGAAQWAASKGFIGVEVDYGTASTHRFWPDNFADGARAVRLVRAQASEWGIDPHQVAVMGFSAGGHLAATLATQPDIFKATEDDLVGKYTARPDAVILAYGVLSFVDGYHPGAYLSTVGNFFGQEGVSQDLRERLSSELQVTKDTPPAFVWTVKDDYLVPPSQSVLFAKACEAKGVKVDFKMYQQGSHGIGLAIGTGCDCEEWTERLMDWLKGVWYVGGWLPGRNVRD